MPATKNSTETPDPDALSFEAALAELEVIVESMEGEHLPLEDLVAQYEAGSKLLKHCDTALATARKRIALITLSNDGAKAPEGSSSATSPDEISEDPDDDNDISLF